MGASQRRDLNTVSPGFTGGVKSSLLKGVLLRTPGVHRFLSALPGEVLRSPSSRSGIWNAVIPPKEHVRSRPLRAAKGGGRAEGRTSWESLNRSLAHLNQSEERLGAGTFSLRSVGQPDWGLKTTSTGLDEARGL